MLRYLLEKEFKQMKQNPIIPRMVIYYPILVMLLFPWALNPRIRHLEITVVDNSHGPYSSRLIRKSTASGYFRLASVEESYSDALSMMEHGKADLILEIPHDFDKDLLSRASGEVQILSNSVDGVKGMLGASYLSYIIADYTRELVEETGNGSLLINMPEIVIKNLYNQNADYKFFIVPGLMAIVLTVLCGFLPAINIVSEKEKGTIEQINVTPIPKFTFILSKIIPYWLIGLFVLTSCMLIARLTYGFFPVGNLLTLYTVILTYVLAISGLGLVISNYARTIQQATFIMLFFMVIFILLSGIFTPIASMPLWAQYLTYLNPMRYLAISMRGVFMRGATLEDLWGHVLGIIVFAFLLNGWAVFSYRKKE